MRTTQAWRVFPPRARPTSGTPSSTARGWKTASVPRAEAAPQAPLGHPIPTPASWGTLHVPRSRSSWKHLNSTRPSWAVSHAVTLKVTPSRRGCGSTRRGCSGRSGRTGLLPRGQHQPGGRPSPAQPSSWPTSGLSLQGRASQPWERGSCWHRPHPLGWGAGWGRERSVGTGLQAWLIHHSWVPLWIRENELERRTEASQCTQSLPWRHWVGGALGWGPES